MKKFYPIKEYRGFIIVEALDNLTCIYYEFAQDIQGKLRFSHENFPTIELIQGFIDNILKNTERIPNTAQSSTVCEECFKHYDLNSELVINKIDRFKSLEIEQKCPNCNHHFLKFNTILN